MTSPSPQTSMKPIRVKTMDGTNKEFLPSEGMTVQAFKELIAESVNVPVNLQRLIFRGRVLQDDEILDEYNLGGNTIHLVQRVIGTSQANLQQDSREQSASNSPQEDGGNAFILGTIDQPNGSSTPRRNSAAVRLQVANDMINRASNILLRLEEEETEDFPAIQAPTRIAEQSAFVATNPNITNMPPRNAGITAARTTNTMLPSNNLMSQIANAAALVATVTHVPSDNNNSLNAPSRTSDNVTPQPPPEAPRVRELATGLQDILALQERLTPFLRLVLNVLRENRQYSSTEAPQFVFDTVSAAIHAVSHSLHALSEVTVDFAAAPDVRRLRAPASIFVEQSTVLRATIPIPINMPGGMQVQGGMQLPAHLQNIVNAATNASLAQGMQSGGVEFRQMHIPTQASLATPAQNPMTPANPSSESNNVTPTARVAPVLQFPTPQQEQNPLLRQHTGSPNQMQLPEFLFGPGGILSNEAMGQQRGEIYDMLLSCHSHHINSQRQRRPENLNEHLENTANASGNVLLSAETHLDTFLQTLSTIEVFHSGIKDLVTGYLLRGRDPRNDSHVLTWAKGIAKKATEWILKTTGSKLKRNPEVDLDATLINVMSQSLVRFIRLVIDSVSPQNFRLSTIRLLEETAHKILVVIKATFSLHTSGRFIRELIDAVLVGSSLTLRRELTYYMIQYLERSVASTGDFIMNQLQTQTQQTIPPVVPMETRGVQVNLQTSTSNANVQTTYSDMDIDDIDDELVAESLPYLPPYLRAVPQSWVDTVRNDLNAQRHAPSQPPLSHGFQSIFPPK